MEISMMAAPSLSVVICTWNRAELLATTLLSLQAQADVPGSQVEVVVVDNNSTDDTRAVVQGLVDGWKLGTLTYFFEPRQGKQFALNSGIRATSMPVLVFTDDDIIFPSDWLSKIQVLFANPAVELAGGKTLLAWGPAGPPKWFRGDMLAILAGVDIGNHRLEPGPSDYAPAGSNLIARRTLFDRMGGYSEKHFRHMDHEFGIRCNRAGAHLVYEPSVVVHAPVDHRCLTKRYFRRWSFKAGISRDEEVSSEAHRLPAVPLWVYRQVVEDAAFTFFLAPFRPAADAFSRELRMWRGLGTIASTWHAWLLPERHAGWVEKYSQKKKNVY